MGTRELQRLYYRAVHSHANASLVLADGCAGAWAVRNSEFGRTFLRRLLDGLLTRHNRVELKTKHWAHRQVAEEDSVDFPRTMCLFLRRSPDTGPFVSVLSQHE